MAVSTSRVGRMLGVVFIAAILGVVGLAVGVAVDMLGYRVVEYVAPHRIPARPGTAPLSIAMVYDVLHGRHPQHGPAWHEAVEARARPVVDAAPTAGPVPEATLDAFDDLAVALDRLGRVTEAVAVMEQKLAAVGRTWPEPPARRPDADGPLEPARRAWYRTRANRGTVLIHAHLKAALGGDGPARARVEEGLGDIRQSIALDPAAHFGRERWQAHAVAMLLKAIDEPIRFAQHDLFGVPSADLRLEGANIFRLTQDDIDALAKPDVLSGMDAEMHGHARAQVPAFEPHADWVEVVDHDGEPVPFDEPALAIIGMWLYGGGPNPHFALTLGNLMRGFGQPYVAWAGYARAWQMRDRFGPGADVLTAYVKKAMAELTEELGQTEDELWAALESEMSAGAAYRAAQAEYEAKHPDVLGDGALDAFFAGRPAITTPPGKADTVFVESPGSESPLRMWGITLWFAALGAWLAAGRLRAHPSEQS